MQLQFEKQVISCLQTVKRELQSQEQTQEVRVSDGMPDIGSIIGSWGQVILRGKEWQGDGMTVSGGTMTWTLYQPEGGGVPQLVESWLPFQFRWSLPQTQQDGTIFACPVLCSVDARTLSSRKMMLRTNVSILGWAMVKQEQAYFAPAEVPADVQLRREQYHMELPVEAGEKAFALEETLQLPPSAPPVEQPLYFTLQPEITEEKMLGDKVVFRGNALLHMLYRTTDGGEYTWDFDLPFTQYSELDAEYGDDARILLWPCVTALETDWDAERLQVKAGLVCQYRISRRQPVDVATDVYSPRRAVEPVMRDLQLPSILESRVQPVHLKQSAPVDGMRLVDTQCLPQSVRIHQTGEAASLELPGRFQMLYYDMDGNLRSASQKWEEKLTMPVGDGAAIEATLWPAGKTQGNLMSGSAALSSDWKLLTETRSDTAIPMITALELGELQQPDPRRPSIILRRAGDQSLWELAKQHGSSVESICSANQLEEEPDNSRMLLIPVI